MLWKTKDGVIMPFEEMKDTHLINTIRMLERNIKNVSDMISDLWTMSCMFEDFDETEEIVACEIKMNEWTKKLNYANNVAKERGLNL